MHFSLVICVLSFVSNCTIHKQPDFSFLPNPGLSIRLSFGPPLKMVFTHLGDLQLVSSCLVACSSAQVQIVILGLIRSHNRTGVKSQYWWHCPCPPSIPPRATTPQEQLAQLGQKFIAPYGVCFGAACMLVCVCVGRYWY